MCSKAPKYLPFKYNLYCFVDFEKGVFPIKKLKFLANKQE